MQKYCLTACFKQNISRKTEFVIDLFTFLLLVVVGFIGSAVLLAFIGVLIQFIVSALGSNIFEYNPINIGIIALFLLVVLTVVITIGYWIVSTSYNFTRNIVANVVAPESAECRIFEPCTKE